MSRLDRVADWEERAKAAAYNARALAKLCSVSYSQLRRYFTAVFRRPPQLYLNELRLGRAAELICFSDLWFGEISDELHFASHSHFCHQFKRQFGCKPSEFPLRGQQRGKSSRSPNQTAPRSTVPTWRLGSGGPGPRVLRPRAEGGPVRLSSPIALGVSASCGSGGKDRRALNGHANEC